MSDASQHSYPRVTIMLDYARAMAGLMFTWLPLVLVDVATIIFYIFGPMAALFALYLGRTMTRHRYTLILEETGLREKLYGTTEISWSEVTELKIRYFSTRRDQSDGWVQVTVRKPGGKIAFDSDLTGYNDVLAAIWEEIGERDVTMNETTLANLAALGYHRKRKPEEETVAEYSA